MSVPSLAAPEAAPSRTSAPGRVRPTPAHGLSAIGETTWDPLRFEATVSHPEEADAPPPASPRLIWSNGRARELPDPGTWCAAVARACAEALYGSRPSTQLHRWLDPEIYTALQRRAGLASRMRSRGAGARAVRVRRVHPCRVRSGVWEVSVILQDGPRVRAAAIRIEAHRGHWRATAVQFA